MAIILSDAYARTGLPQSAANDALLTASMNVTLAVLEKYLDRKFTFDTQTDTFYYTHGCDFQLDRYPVQQITNVTKVSDHKLNHLTGTVRFKHNIIEDEIKVTYAGGYRVLPADLELAYWLLFDAVWAMGQSGGGGGLAAGAIQSITVPDVGTIRYATGAATGAGSGGGSGNGDPSDLIPAAALALLNPYMRYKA